MALFFSYCSVLHSTLGHMIEISYYWSQFHSIGQGIGPNMFDRSIEFIRYPYHARVFAIATDVLWVYRHILVLFPALYLWCDIYKYSLPSRCVYIHMLSDAGKCHINDIGLRVWQPWFEFWLWHFTAVWTVPNNSHFRSFGFLSVIKISPSPVFQDFKGTQKMWGHNTSSGVSKHPAWDFRMLATNVWLLKTI